MAGFTRTSNTHAPCYGVNHHDSGMIGICDGCGMDVAKREDGKIFDIFRTGVYQARKIVCWSGTHRCNPDHVATYAAEKAAKLDAGIIVKGCRVVVFKGRKVPVGTEGRVTWQGTDSYGKARLGMITDSGESIFMPAEHCRPV